MKKSLICALVVYCFSSVAAYAAETTSVQALLNEMNKASQQLNYQLSYIVINRNTIEPLQYSHAVENNVQLAHLVYLSGPMREIIRRGGEVSYIDSSSEPFTIRANYMVAPTIPLLNSNIKQLSQYYDFVPLGKAREAGATCQVIRVVSKDGMRYSYVLWVDEKTKLPLRADLVDRDGDILEQFRTIALAVGDGISKSLSKLQDVQLPQVLSLPQGNLKHSYWKVTWVPNGFKPEELNRYKLSGTEQMVESQLYSDGLFDFSVYVSDRNDQSLKSQLVRQGRRTLQIYASGKNEVAVIGDIPPETALRIARSVTFTPLKAKKVADSTSTNGAESGSATKSSPQ